MTTRTTVPLLDGIVDPVGSALNDEAARKLIGLKADRRVQARVAKLAGKCSQGKLTADERHEYEMYIMAGDFVAMLQAKARIVLNERGQSL